MPCPEQEWFESSLPAARRDEALQSLEELHSRVRQLLRGELEQAPPDDPDGYFGWYLHLRTEGLRAIAADGWIDRHRRDVALLAASPALRDCCRATVTQLYGLQAFHVAAQHFPNSDGMVRRLCHGHWDRFAHAKHIAGQLVGLRTAYGTHRPPGLDGDYAVSVFSPAFDATPI